MQHQTALPLSQKRAHRNHDFVNLFPGSVFPTGEVDILERGEHLLVIKSYEHKKKIADAHGRIYRLLVRFGQNPEAPGSITVVCVWGLGNTTREWCVYDHLHQPSPMRGGTVQDFREWLLDWWKSHR